MIHFEVVKGNIIDQDVDVIVTAANQGLNGGGGVDGAVHQACGKGLLDECRALGGCSTGKAKLTRSYNMADKGVPWIIHAVGPRYAGGMYFEADLLTDAYLSALAITGDYRHVYEQQCLEVLDSYIGHLDDAQKAPYIRDTVEEVREYTSTHPIKSIAFPSISTGVYGYPLKEAAYIATKTIKNYCRCNSHLDKIVLVCFDTETYNTYKKLV